MSVASVNPDIMIDLRSDASFSQDEEFRKAYVAACRASSRGEPIPQACCPKRSSRGGGRMTNASLSRKDCRI